MMLRLQWLFFCTSLFHSATLSGWQEHPATWLRAAHDAASPQSGDVLIRITETLDATKMIAGADSPVPVGQLLEVEMLYRVVFDNDFQRVICYKLRNIDHLDLGRGNEDTVASIEKFFWSAAKLDRINSRFDYRSNSQSEVNLNLNDASAPVRLGNGGEYLCDLRYFWYSGGLDFGKYDKHRENIEIQCVTPKAQWHLEGTKDETRLVFSGKVMSPGSALRYRKEYVFDPNLLVLRRHRLLIDSEVGTGEHWSWNIDWKTLNNVQVPVRLTRREKGVSPYSKHQPESGEQLTTMQFHWFSVNENVDELLSDDSPVGGLTRVLELTDVRLNKATDIKIFEPASDE